MKRRRPAPMTLDAPMNVARLVAFREARIARATRRGLALVAFVAAFALAVARCAS